MSRTFLLAASFLLACSNPIKEIAPQFRSGVQELSKEISSEISFQELSVHTEMNMSTGERTSKNLEITLTDAHIKSLNRVKPDSLSSRISEIAKKHIGNISDYDWVTIMYLTSDGTQASDSTDHNVYVIRPNEIKSTQPHPIRRT